MVKIHLPFEQQNFRFLSADLENMDIHWSGNDILSENPARVIVNHEVVVNVEGLVL